MGAFLCRLVISLQFGPEWVVSKNLVPGIYDTLRHLKRVMHIAGVHRRNGIAAPVDGAFTFADFDPKVRPRDVDVFVVLGE